MQTELCKPQINRMGGLSVAELLTVQALFTLFMLILLQAVLGFDNLLYIAIESNKVGDEEDAKKVRRWGIGIAVALRIILLFVIVNLFGLLAKPLFGAHIEGIFEGDFTFQALVTLLGGAFIIYTAIKEIHHLLQVDHIEHSEGGGLRSVAGAIALIVAMNLVFSVDSILSAMAIASVDASNVINAAGETLSAFAGNVTECKQSLIANPVAGAMDCEPTKTKNRMYQVLGLFILFLVGVLLVTEGAHLAHLKLFGFEIAAMSKSSFYLVVFVLIVTDIISNRYQNRLWAQKQAEIIGSTETAGREAVDAFKGKKPGAH